MEYPLEHQMTPLIETSPYQVSPASDKFWPAWVKALGSIQSAAKDAKNPQFNSKYANLNACDEAVRPHLTANKLGYMQFPSTNKAAGTVKVTTMVVHESGQFLQWDLELPVADLSTPQKAGSGITYVRRYAFAGFGLVSDEDDDGNAASTPANKQQAYPQRPQSTSKADQAKAAAPAKIEAAPAKEETGPPRPVPVSQRPEPTPEPVQAKEETNGIWNPELFALLNQAVEAHGYQKQVVAFTQFLEKGLMNPDQGVSDEDKIAYMKIAAVSKDAIQILQKYVKMSGGAPLKDVVKQVIEVGPAEWLASKQK